MITRENILKSLGDDRIEFECYNGIYAFELKEYSEKYTDENGFDITHCVYTPKLTDLSIEQWVEEGREFIALIDEK